MNDLPTLGALVDAADRGLHPGVHEHVDHGVRGRGYGQHLSTLLATAVPLPDDQCLIGTIHADNVTSYRSTLAAGRVDVGGEIIVPL